MPSRSSIHSFIPAPMPSIERPPEISSSAANSIAIVEGLRVYGLTTPIPTLMVEVAAAAADAIVNAPRQKGSSGTQKVP